MTGSSSVGGPKQLKSEQRRSVGSKFDSIIAMLCYGAFYLYFIFFRVHVVRVVIVTVFCISVGVQRSALNL